MRCSCICRRRVFFPDVGEADLVVVRIEKVIDLTAVGRTMPLENNPLNFVRIVHGDEQVVMELVAELE